MAKITMIAPLKFDDVDAAARYFDTHTAEEMLVHIKATTGIVGADRDQYIYVNMDAEIVATTMSDVSLQPTDEYYGGGYVSAIGETRGY